MSTLTFFWAALMSLAPAPLQATDSQTNTETLFTCSRISASEERLSCFDREVAKLRAARDAGQIAIVDRKAAVARQQQRFGGRGVVTKEDERQGDIAPVREVSSTVAQIRPSSNYGRYLIALANKSVWETTEQMSFPPKTGSAITIKRAAMGAYRAQLGSGRPFGVKRLR